MMSTIFCHLPLMAGSFGRVLLRELSERSVSFETCGGMLCGATDKTATSLAVIMLWMLPKLVCWLSEYECIKNMLESPGTHSLAARGRCWEVETTTARGSYMARYLLTSARELDYYDRFHNIFRRLSVLCADTLRGAILTFPHMGCQLQATRNGYHGGKCVLNGTDSTEVVLPLACPHGK